MGPMNWGAENETSKASREREYEEWVPPQLTRGPVGAVVSSPSEVRKRTLVHLDFRAWKNTSDSDKFDIFDIFEAHKIVVHIHIHNY